MADIAPMATESFNEIKMWVPEPYLQEFLQQFDYDLKLIELAHRLFANNGDVAATAKGEEAQQEYAELVRCHPPKHWLTFEYISNEVRHQEAQNGELLDELERLGREAHTASIEKPDMVFEPLANWLSPGF